MPLDGSDDGLRHKGGITTTNITLRERNGSSLYVQEIQRAALRNARIQSERKGKDISDLDVEKRILAKLRKPVYKGISKNRWLRFYKLEHA